jgi:hypothetical protein
LISQNKLCSSRGVAIPKKNKKTQKKPKKPKKPMPILSFWGSVWFGEKPKITKKNQKNPKKPKKTQKKPMPI